MDPKGSERTEDRGDQTRKRPYEPPRILSEGIFETTALACGKKPSQGGKCGFGGSKTS
jgi:hypothetical protein